MAHLRVHVHEMDCAEEAALVRRALTSNKAIENLEFDLIHGFVDVTFDDGRTSESAIVQAVRSTGLAAHTVHGVDGHRAVASEHAAHDHQTRSSTVALAGSGTLFLVGWIVDGIGAATWLEVFAESENSRAALAYALSAVAGVWPLLPRAAAAIRHFRLDMHALVCLTVIGAAAIGEWSEGAAVAFLFGLAHRMEAWSIERARREIAALVGRGPSMVAHRPHIESVDVHGVDRVQQWGVPSGQVERWVERFAAVYTPIVTGAAVIVAVVPPLIDGQWTTWLYRALLFLVLACPCALVISTPVTLIAALSSAARRGVLVKGGAVLERAAEAATPSREGLRNAGVVVVGATTLSELEGADVVLTQSDERSIALLVTHARRAMRVVKQNVAIALLTKAAFLALAPFGYAPLWMAVLADTGATVIVTMNGLRLLQSRTTTEVSN